MPAQPPLAQLKMGLAVLPALIADLIAAGCEVRGDTEARAADARVLSASEADWYTEYLDAWTRRSPTSAATAPRTPTRS